MSPIELIERKRQVGLTDNQALVMLRIGDKLRRLQEIADLCGLNPSSVSRVVYVLRRLGYLEDSRPVVKFGKCEPAFFWLTESGIQAVAKILGK